MNRRLELVYRLAYNGDVAAGQLAVFQGGPSRTGGKAPISELIWVERATRKNSQLAAARRVALKMGRRLRCSSVTSRTIFVPCGRKPYRSVKMVRDAPPIASSPPRALPTAHFERNDITIICETVHQVGKRSPSSKRSPISFKCLRASEFSSCLLRSSLWHRSSPRDSPPTRT